MSRLGLASKAPKTYLSGPGNLTVPKVPLVSEGMSHVSNFCQRVSATSEKNYLRRAGKPPHIMSFGLELWPSLFNIEAAHLRYARVNLVARPRVDLATRLRITLSAASTASKPHASKKARPVSKARPGVGLLGAQPVSRQTTFAIYDVATAMPTCIITPRSIIYNSAS